MNQSILNSLHAGWLPSAAFIQNQLFSKSSFRNSITASNGLDPDLHQDCLQMLSANNKSHHYHKKNFKKMLSHFITIIIWPFSLLEEPNKLIKETILYLPYNRWAWLHDLCLLHYFNTLQIVWYRLWFSWIIRLDISFIGSGLNDLLIKNLLVVLLHSCIYIGSQFEAKVHNFCSWLFLCLIVSEKRYF